MRNSIALTLVGIVVCAGCRSSVDAVDHAVTAAVSSPVDLVRYGWLPAPYNTAQVGSAFSGTFNYGNWKSFVTKHGGTVVEFDGTISAFRDVEVHDGMITNITIRQSPGAVKPIQLQFMINPDKTFFIYYVHLDGYAAFNDRGIRSLLKLIFQS